MFHSFRENACFIYFSTKFSVAIKFFSCIILILYLYQMFLFKNKLVFVKEHHVVIKSCVSKELFFYVKI